MRNKIVLLALLFAVNISAQEESVFKFTPYFSCGYFGYDTRALNDWLVKRNFENFKNHDEGHFAFMFDGYVGRIFCGLDFDGVITCSKGPSPDAFGMRVPLGIGFVGRKGWRFTEMISAGFLRSAMNFPDRQPDEFWPADTTVWPDRAKITQTTWYFSPAIRMTMPDLEWNKRFSLAFELGYYEAISTSQWFLKYYQYYPQSDTEDSAYTIVGHVNYIPGIAQHGFYASVLLGFW